MATIVYRNAVVVVDGASLAASLNELAMNYAAEMLDETCYGDTTRINKGGLLVASVAGKGFAESGDNLIEPVIFNDVGVDDAVVAVFPHGIVEGAQSGAEGIGYAMKGVASEFMLGGAVGALLPLSFTYEGRGID